jgi:hypothetical protein
MDHVPPENLFETGQKGNLVTVPSCRQCNNAASREGQYFLVYLALRRDAKQKPEHEKVLSYSPKAYSEAVSRKDTETLLR